MPWFSISDPSGRGGWAFDPDGAAHIIRGNHYNRELVRRSRYIRRDHGFLMPKTTEVETDTTGIKAHVGRLARTTINELERETAQKPRQLYEFLVQLRSDGEEAGVHWHKMSRKASRATADAIASNVARWENGLSVTRFLRDTSAGVLFVGATVLSGGTALAVGAGATGLTFTGNTQDNLANNQTMRQAMGNAAVSTSFAVVTNLLIPKGLTAVGRGSNWVMAGDDVARSLTFGDNVALGLLSVAANVTADMTKTALTSSGTADAVANAAAKQFERQIGARSGYEISAMVFQSWLSSRGIPAAAFLSRNADAVSSVTGGAISAVGDRIVSAIATQNQQAAQKSRSASPDLDMVMTQLKQTMDAEDYVRQVAMRPT